MKLNNLYKRITQNCERYRRMRRYSDTPAENINFVIFCIFADARDYRNAEGSFKHLERRDKLFQRHSDGSSIRKYASLPIQFRASRSNHYNNGTYPCRS